MRTLLLLSTLPFTLLAAAGCSDSLGNEDLDRSLESWEQARDSAPLGYSYVRYSDGLGAAGDEREQTIVYVDDGEVLRRVWQRVAADNVVMDSWEEYGTDQVGSHDAGHDAVTIDDLYGACSEVLADAGELDGVAVSFATFASGVLRDCYYTDAAGAVVGIRLEEVTFEDEEGDCVAGVAGGVGRPCL